MLQILVKIAEFRYFIENIWKRPEIPVTKLAPNYFESLELFKNKFQKFRKPVWFPKTKSRISSPQSSKFAGIPVFLKDESWPTCVNCCKPMQLFLQLNSNDLPKKVNRHFGDGFLQVFYCTTEEPYCEIDGEGAEPFNRVSLVRILDFDDAGPYQSELPYIENAFPELEIVDWEVKDDFPQPDEPELMGQNFSKEEIELFYRLNYDKDKLLGWPAWVQGVAYPLCPICGEMMNYIFQIDSVDNLPHFFGDMGIAHITQCSNHRKIVALNWNCG